MAPTSPEARMEEGESIAHVKVIDRDDEPRRKQNTIANPAPLGLFAFGVTTCMLMFVVTGWSSSAFVTTVMCFAVFYGGLAQMVAGIFEMVKGNTFAATAFFSYGSFWCGWFLMKYFAASAPVAGAGMAKSDAVGATLFDVIWGVFTLAFFIPTLRKNGALMTVFGSLTCTFFLLAGGHWSASCDKAAGYVGFFCGCSAIYTAIAEIYRENLDITLPGLRPVRFI